MTLHADSRHALELLERIQEKLLQGDDISEEDDLTSLIYMLDSPLFSQLLNLQDAIQQLKQVQTQRPISSNDFDFSPSSGELILTGGTPSDEDWDSAVPQDYTTGTSSVESVSPSMSPPAQALPLQSAAATMHNSTSPPSIEEAAQGRPVHVIDLYKAENSSLGFSVVGLRSEHRGELGIFVQEIQPGGIAARDGRLQEHDHILAINDQVLDANISHQEAIRILQRTNGQVRLVIARGPGPVGPSSEAGEAPPPAEETQTAIVTGGSAGTAEALTAPPPPQESSDMVLSTEWTQIEVLELINDGSGLGFGIIGGKSTGVVVKTILPGGIADKDGRLHSGDHIIQIGDVNVRGMGSEQVATVLRQSGSNVRLIVARSVNEPFPPSSPHAPIVPTHQLDDHLLQMYAALKAMDQSDELEYQMNNMTPEELQQFTLMHPEIAAQIHQNPMEDGFLPPSADMEFFEVELVKGTQGLGITIAGYVGEKTAEELSGIFVKSIADGSAAALDGRIQVNDQIIEVDNQSLEGFSNHQAVEVLRNTGQVVRLRLARYKHGLNFELPQYPTQPFELTGEGASGPMESELMHANSQLSLEDITLNQNRDEYSEDLSPDVEALIIEKWQKELGEDYTIVVAQLSKFREGGGLGISLEGTVDVQNGQEVHPHHYIRSVLNDGPVGMNGRLQSGDELLEVNGRHLLGLNHVEVVTILKELPRDVRIVCARRKLPAQPDLVYAPASLAATEPLSSVVGAESLLFHPSAEPSTAAAAASTPMSPEQHPPHQYYSGVTGASTLPPHIPTTMPADSNVHLVKAKSEQSLPITPGALETSLNKMKSRSLEPLTGLAMWSSEPVQIDLQKGDRGLGFSILDYQDPINPAETVIVIRSLVPGGVAQMDGRLVPGDRLLYVNDVILDNAKLEEAVNALKGAQRGVVRIGVAKPLPLPEIGESSTDDPIDAVIQPIDAEPQPIVFTASSGYGEPPSSSTDDMSPPHSPPPPPPPGGSPGEEEGEGEERTEEVAIGHGTLQELNTQDMDVEAEELGGGFGSSDEDMIPLVTLKVAAPARVQQSRKLGRPEQIQMMAAHSKTESTTSQASSTFSEGSTMSSNLEEGFIPGKKMRPARKDLDESPLATPLVGYDEPDEGLLDKNDPVYKAREALARLEEVTVMTSAEKSPRRSPAMSSPPVSESSPSTLNVASNVTSPSLSSMISPNQVSSPTSLCTPTLGESSPSSLRTPTLGGSMQGSRSPLMASPGGRSTQSPLSTSSPSMSDRFSLGDMDMLKDDDSFGESDMEQNDGGNEEKMENGKDREKHSMGSPEHSIDLSVSSTDNSELNISLSTGSNPPTPDQSPAIRSCRPAPPSTSVSPKRSLLSPKGRLMMPATTGGSPGTPGTPGSQTSSSSLTSPSLFSPLSPTSPSSPYSPSDSTTPSGRPKPRVPPKPKSPHISEMLAQRRKELEQFSSPSPPHQMAAHSNAYISEPSYDITPMDIRETDPHVNTQVFSSVRREDSPPPYKPPTPVTTSPASTHTTSDLNSPPGGGGASSASSAASASQGSSHSSPVPSPSLSPRVWRGGFGWSDIPPLPSALERNIKIKKGNDQLGVTVDTVDKAINGCVVKTISPLGAVGRDGRLALGDYVVSINNESMRRITNAQARAILRRAALLGSDISISYIPGTDAEVHKQSAMIALREQGPPPATNQLSPK